MCDQTECPDGEAGMPDSGTPPTPEGGEGGAPPDVGPVADAGEAGAITASGGATSSDSELIIVLEGNGTVTVSGEAACLSSPCSYLTVLGVMFQLQAKPGADSRFVGWSGDCSGDMPSTSVAVSGPRECIATFAVQRAVSAAVGATGGGTVVTDPNLSCNASGCKGQVDDHSSVTLKATPKAGFRFVNWTGGSECEGIAQATLGIQVTQDVACTATFAKQYGLAVSAVGANAKISVTNGNCIALACQADADTSATFEASPVAGYRFTGWTGDSLCTGTTSPLVIAKVNTDITCLANYVARFTATGLIGGGLAGTVSATGDVNATCPSTPGNTCTADANTKVTLLAPTIAGNYLANWSGCTGTQSGNGIVVTPTTANVTCTANYVVGVSVTGTVVGATGTVTATSASPGSDCTKTLGSCTISSGGTVTLAAPTSIVGYRFNGWSGDAGCTGATTTIVLSNVISSKSCSANYVQQFTIASVTSPGGTVSASKGGGPCAGNSCTVDKDVSVSLGATPDTANGYHFNSWTGAGCPGANNPLTLVNVTATCTATFGLDTFTITAKSGTGGNATATRLDTNVECGGDSCAVTFGTPVRLDAIPATNYHFSGWTGANCPTTGNPITLKNVTATCTAAFAINTFSAQVSATPTGSGTVGIVCPGNNCNAVAYGQSVNVSATPNTGWAFASWSTNCAGGTATVTATTNCVATFIPIVTGTAANGAGTITLVSPSVTCSNGNPATCAVLSGNQIVLTAVPGANSVFTSWSGDCLGSNAAVTLTNVTTPKNCTANFYKLWARSTGGKNLDGTSHLVSLADGTLVGMGISLPEGGKQYGLSLVDFEADTGKLLRNDRIIDANAAGEFGALGLTTNTDQKSIVALGLHVTKAAQRPLLHNESPANKFDIEYAFKNGQTAAIGGEVITTLDGGYAFCTAVLDAFDGSGAQVATSHLTKVDVSGKVVAFDVAFCGTSGEACVATRPFDVIQDPTTKEFVVLSQVLTGNSGLLLTFISDQGVYKTSTFYQDSVDLFGAQLVVGASANSYFVVGWRVEGKGTHDGFFAELNRTGSAPNFAFSLGVVGANEQFTSVTKTGKNQYAVAGYFDSKQGNEAWLVLIGKDGSISSQLGYGGPNDEQATAVTTVPAGGFALGGGTTSWGSTLTDNDMWQLRVGPDGALAFNANVVPPAVLSTPTYKPVSLTGIKAPTLVMKPSVSNVDTVSPLIKITPAGFAQVVQSQ